VGFVIEKSLSVQKQKKKEEKKSGEVYILSQPKNREFPFASAPSIASNPVLKIRKIETEKGKIAKRPDMSFYSPGSCRQVMMAKAGSAGLRHGGKTRHGTSLHNLSYRSPPAMLFDDELRPLATYPSLGPSRSWTATLGTGNFRCVLSGWLMMSVSEMPLLLGAGWGGALSDSWPSG
jgi:hypothetical protein